MDETGATEKKVPPDEARNEAPGPTAPRSGGMTEKADRVDRESPAKRNSPGPIQRVIEATIGGFFSTVAANKVAGPSRDNPSETVPTHRIEDGDERRKLTRRQHGFDERGISGFHWEDWEELYWEEVLWEEVHKDPSDDINVFSMQHGELTIRAYGRELQATGSRLSLKAPWLTDRVPDFPMNIEFDIQPKRVRGYEGEDSPLARLEFFFDFHDQSTRGEVRSKSVRGCGFGAVPAAKGFSIAALERDPDHYEGYLAWEEYLPLEAVAKIRFEYADGTVRMSIDGTRRASMDVRGATTTSMYCTAHANAVPVGMNALFTNFRISI